MKFPANDPNTQLQEDHPLCQCLQIQTHQLVPIVIKYKYLGLIFTPAFCKQTMTKHHLKQAQQAVRALIPFFQCQTLPVAMRVQILQSVVIPYLLYRAELYGMNPALTNQIQGMVNNILKAILGLPTKQINPIHQPLDRDTYSSNMCTGCWAMQPSLSEMPQPEIHNRGHHQRTHAECTLDIVQWHCQVDQAFLLQLPATHP